MAPKRRSRRTCSRASRGRGRAAVWRSRPPLGGAPGAKVVAVAALFAAISLPAAPETYRLEVTADTSIAAHPRETTHNLGGSSRIRIKGIQHFMLMRFDLEPVRAMTAARATLHLRSASEKLWLKTVGLSTISADWQEGTARGEPQEGAVCFQYAAFPDRLWAGPQSDFTDVTFGVGNTLCAYADIRTADDGWLEVDVPPELVQAMICGDSYGLVLSDEKGQTMANNDVYSREQTASRPYLTVEAERTDTEPPDSPISLTVEPAPDLARLDSGAARLTFTAPAGAFTYEGTVRAAGRDEAPIPRYRIPRAGGPGAPQSIELPEIVAGQPVTVRLRSVDGAGNTSEWAQAEGQSSPALPLPEIARGGWHTGSPDAARSVGVPVCRQG